MRTAYALTSTFLLVTLSLAAGPACSGGEGGSTNGNTGGGGSGAGGSGGGNAGPCVPFGTWKLTYEAPQTNTCLPSEDTVTVTKNTDGSISVSFEGDNTMPMDECSGPSPTPGTYTTTGSVSADGCTLTLGSSTSYCFSGESQCEKRAITLQISGDDATGTLEHEVCFCPSPGPVTANATGKRAP